MSSLATLHHIFRDKLSLNLSHKDPPVPPFQYWNSKQLCEALDVCAGDPFQVFTHVPPAHDQLRHLLVSPEIFLGKLKDVLIK